MQGWPVTEKQTDYIRALQRRLHLPDRMLDDHCATRFGTAFTGLDRAQASALIDELQGWTEIPAGMQRALGQLDLFGGA